MMTWMIVAACVAAYFAIIAVMFKYMEKRYPNFPDEATPITAIFIALAAPAILVIVYMVVCSEIAKWAGETGPILWKRKRFVKEGDYGFMTAEGIEKNIRTFEVRRDSACPGCHYGRALADGLKECYQELEQERLASETYKAIVIQYGSETANELLR